MKTENERFLEFNEIMRGKYYVGDLMIEWLKEEGFFTAPASTKYHGNYEGGLFDHSIVVTGALVELTENLNLKWQRESSPYIVGMFHDLCKIDNYLRCGEAWTHNTKADSRHGEKSVDLLLRFFELTEEEIICIRWHMGAYDDKSNWNALGKAIEKYPNVLFTHTADVIAARIKGI